MKTRLTDMFNSDKFALVVEAENPAESVLLKLLEDKNSLFFDWDRDNMVMTITHEADDNE